MTYRFELLLAVTWPTPEAFFDLADGVHAACDDCSLGVQGGVATAEFARDAASLRAAVDAAVADVTAAGFRVQSVRTEESEAVAEINGRLEAGRPAEEAGRPAELVPV